MVQQALASPRLAVGAGLQVLNARWHLRSASSLGPLVRVQGHRLHVVNHGTLLVGARANLITTFAPSVLAVFPGGRLEIGPGAILNYGFDVCATGLVRIGAESMLGTHLILLDNDFHKLDDRKCRPDPRPVLIGDRVWLGNRVIVMPGTIIGDGSVIGAGSVVRGEIPPGVLAAGNPARVIRRIVDDEGAGRLADSRASAGAPL